MNKNFLILLVLTVFTAFAFTGLSKTEAHIEISTNKPRQVTTQREDQISQREREEEERLKYIEELVDEKIYLLWRASGIELMEAISAESFTIVNLSQDRNIILKKDDAKKYPIASITKLLSSVVAMENLDIEEKITLTPAMLQSYGYSPSLFPGAIVKAKDLMSAALTQSTNDAAETLTYFMDKGVLVGMMNIKAQQIGMKNSFFYDAHGLSPKNVSTADDIVRLLEYIMENHPEILEITCLEHFQLPNIYGTPLTFRNLNLLHNIPKENFIGGKTGYLPEAKQTYTSLFKVGDETFAVVILMSENRRSDLEKIYEWLNKNPRIK